MGCRRALGLVAAALLLLGAPGAAAGDMYVYRDAGGTLHFSNAPTKSGYRRYGGMSRGRRAGIADRANHHVFDPIIQEAAARHRVDAALVKAVIRAESGFIPYARSPKGALGLMQLMPPTARMHNVARIFEPRDNIEGGVKHLRLLLDRYDGNVRLALAAYNAGGDAVERYGGIPPYPETIQYLHRVLRFREHYRRRKQ